MGKRYLIDTHVLLWWIFDDPKLNRDIREIIKNPSNKIMVSSASAWEIATKYRIGKLPEAKELVENYDNILNPFIGSNCQSTHTKPQLMLFDFPLLFAPLLKGGWGDL